VFSLRDSPLVYLTRNAVRGALSAIAESNTLQKDSTLAVCDTADNATAEAMELDLMLRDNSPLLPTHNAVADVALLPRGRAAGNLARAGGISRGAARGALPVPTTRLAPAADQAAGEEEQPTFNKRAHDILMHIMGMRAKYEVLNNELEELCQRSEQLRVAFDEKEAARAKLEEILAALEKAVT
jgi:hypothetical protein